MDLAEKSATAYASYIIKSGLQGSFTSKMHSSQYFSQDPDGDWQVREDLVGGLSAIKKKAIEICVSIDVNNAESAHEEGYTIG